MSDRPGTVRPVLCAACAVLVTLTLAGCAAPPQKEMDQAEGAIATARAAGAAQYAAAEFAAAETALSRSQEAAAQRDYRQALNHALDARERAQTSAREAADKKALARGLAERAITSAELALALAQQRLGAAVASAPVNGRKAPAQGAAFKTLQLAVAAAGVGVQEARSQMQAQRFDDALKTAAPLAEQIQAATRAYDEMLAAGPASRPARRGR
jgi:hypothetical protein